MAIEMPGSIAAYFTADRDGGADAVARCFTGDGVVRDEGKSHAGTDAIRRWKSAASKEYDYTVQPFAIVGEGDRMVVTAHLEGNFPGSPTDLRYRFLLEGEKIVQLDIGT